MFFVLKSENYGAHRTHNDGYYTGDKYIYQSEYYAVCDNDISKAKKYTSLKRAENACEKLNQRITNYLFTVKELVGDGDGES